MSVVVVITTSGMAQGNAVSRSHVGSSFPLGSISGSLRGAVGQSTDPIVAAAGDIACDPQSTFFNGGNGTTTACRQKYTSDLLLDSGLFSGLAAVLALGDDQYENGAYTKFLGSYDLSWGRVKALTRPVPGNHEYGTTGAAGYYQYFGAAAGDPSKGYYSFDVGAWHLIALNSNCAQIGGCGPGSLQEQWLRADLAGSGSACVLAYWHHPRFSSGPHGNDASYDAFWRDLYSAGADVVLVGHDHLYERFAPQNPDQVPDTSGIREFVVGTGGRELYSVSSVQSNSEVRIAGTFGVLKLTLSPGSYAWEFISETGSVLDTGSTVCSAAMTPRAPGAPTLMSASGASGAVNVQWAAPASDGGGAISGYKIYRGTSSGTETLLGQVGNQTSYSDTSVVNGTTYWYRVSAVNSVGEGPLSNELSATPSGASSLIVDDQFERTVASGLGSADVGGVWRVNSTARTKVQNGEAVVYGWTGAGQDVHAWQETVRQDMELLALVRLNATNPTGGSYKARLVARAQTDARNGYYAAISHTPAGVVTWQLSRIDNSGGTGSLSLGAGTLQSSGGAGTSWWIRLRVQGPTIQVRYWRDGTPEPSTWKTSVTDNYFASGRPSFGVSTGTGITTPFPNTSLAGFTAVELH